MSSIQSKFTEYTKNKKCDPVSRENTIKRSQPWDDSNVGIREDGKPAVITVLFELQGKIKHLKWMEI